MELEKAIKYTKEIVRDSKNEIKGKDYFEYIMTPNDIEAIDIVLKELDNVYLELQKQDCEIRKLKLENIEYQLSQLPDIAETYKELKKQYEKLLNKE